MKCPFCFEHNHCAVDTNSTAERHQPCWCFTVNVPDCLLQLIPQEKQALVCVCQKCLLQYQQDKEAFIRRFSMNP